jgi:hypothetical protein
MAREARARLAGVDDAVAVVVAKEHGAGKAEAPGRPRRRPSPSTQPPITGVVPGVDDEGSAGGGQFSEYGAIR